jgi:hypothetical protein
MKLHPCISWVVFLIATPIGRLGDRLYGAGIFLRDTQFRPQVFTCAECSKRTRELVVREIWQFRPGHHHQPARVCRRCYDDVIF